jgi:acetyltransferase-like isoleucine patch superfamily enzyme
VKVWIWEHLADPILRRIVARIEHLELRRSPIHDGASWRQGAKIGQSVLVHKDAAFSGGGSSESLTVGDFCNLYGQIWLLGAGRLSIDHHSFLGPRSRIWCTERIEIGSHVLISHDVDIHDSNAHSLRWQDRRQEIAARFERGDHSVPPGVPTAPIYIHDDVWIGFKSSILKGVTIGRGAVVAAGSVVTKDVPPFTLVAGNPARVIRDLPQ